jgi:MFS family permease
MLGWVVTSILAGQIVSRTGRYKLLPIVGSFIVVLGFYLLTRLGVHSTSTTAIVDMVVLGLGMGMVFQIYLVAMQNSIRPQDMGSATATVQFFRSMGATFGVGAFGTVFITRLTSQLVHRIGPAVRHVNISALISAPGHTKIPPAIANDVRLSLSSALHGVFVGTLCVVIVAMLCSFLLKEKPLRTTSNLSGTLSSEMSGQSEEGAQQAAEATHDREPAGRTAPH